MIVIADDITGAAEIAGMAFSRGAAVRLVCGGGPATARLVGGRTAATDGTAATGITVIATDTRSMAPDAAAAETQRIMAACADAFSAIGSLFSIFKKTDSALRGNVLAELAAIMQVVGYRRAVYLPANPSKGRTIRHGVYYISGVPIHETAFSYDPEFPAHTSVLRERFPEAERHGIIMPDAMTMEDMRRVVTTYNDGKTIFAGAADLFAAVMDACCPQADSGVLEASHGALSDTSQDTLILCGSTQSKVLDLGIPVAPMPRAIYDGATDLQQWDTSAYSSQHSLILTISDTHRTGKEVAVHLRTMMAAKAQQLIQEHRPRHLIIEGGATAWATLQTLGWTEFNITAQLAPGVVQMTANNGTVVTLKPGSYPWGSIFTK